MNRPTSRTVRWWWVRHAPADTTAGEARSFCGWSDPAADLSDEHGLAKLRSALPEECAVVSSDLWRATQTADAIARRNFKRMPVNAKLREQNFGDWEGQTYDSIDLTEFWRNPAMAAPPGGESFAEVCDRVGREILRLNNSSEPEIVAVAHAGSVRAALALALDLPPSKALAFEIAPMSLTRIDWLVDARAWRVGCVNLGV